MAVVLLAVGAMGCDAGWSAHKLSNPTATKIGRLVAGYGGDLATPAPTPFVQTVKVIPCAEYRLMSGHEPYYLKAVPVRAGRLVCFGPPATPAGSPAAVGGVMYVPQGHLDADLPDIWAAGGLLVADNWSAGAISQLGPPGPETNPDGTRRWAKTVVAGKQAYVSALPNPPRIEVRLAEVRKGGGGSLIQIQGAYSPDEIVHITSSISEGLPPDALALTAPPSE